MFFIGRLKVLGHKLEIYGFRASEFRGALRDRVFSFCWRRRGPLGTAKARVMANDDVHPRRILTVVLFVASGFGGDPGGVKDQVWSQAGPWTPPESV